MGAYRNIRIISWFNFFTDFRFYTPIIILYFTEITGSFTLGMSLISISQLSYALLNIPTGVLSDKIPRSKITIWGAAASVISVLLYAIGSSYSILAIGAVLEGLARALYSGNNNALLHDTLAESKQEHDYHIYFGKTAAMFQFASAGASIIGGIIAAVSVPLVMWLSIIPQLVCFFLSTELTEPKNRTPMEQNLRKHLGKSVRQIIHNKKLRWLSAGNIVGFAVGETSYEFQAVFYNLLWPVWAIGIARTLSNIAGGISFYFSSKIIKKLEPIKILIGETVITPLIKLITVIFPTPLSPALMASTSITYGLETVSKTSLMNKEYSNQERATMSAIISFCANVLSAVAAIAIGFIADKYGVITTIVITQLILLSLTVVYVRVFYASKLK